MRVLYVNHTGHVSGGERSLLEILRGVAGTVEPLVACPEGPLVDALAGLGIDRVAIPGTDGSLKLHPRHTSRALWEMSRAAAAVRAIAARERVDLIHANSIRAGLIVSLARRAGAPPAIAHLRDRLPDSRVSTWTLRALAGVDVLVANSAYTAASLRTAGVERPAHVLFNPVDLRRFTPDPGKGRAQRERLHLDPGDFVISLVAQITPWKGQEEAIRALTLVRRARPRARLLLAGSAKFLSKATRYDNATYLAGLHRLVDESGLGDSVRFLGECDDVPGLLAASDLLLVPSWAEPFGRSVIEAMALQVPVIATAIGGPAEIIEDGVDGLLVPPRRPELWAEAIDRVIRDAPLRASIAAAGRVRAGEFGVARHADALCRLYGELLGRGAPVHPEASPHQLVNAA